MTVNDSYLRFSGLVGLLFAAGVFALAITYAFISNLSLWWIICLVVIALIEIVVFTFSILLLINPKRKIFFIGSLALFAGLVPGLMILGYYFKTKKALVKNFELNS